MNYIIFCDKAENKIYAEMFKSAANSNLLAAESNLSNESIDNIKIEYNPHGIIIANPAIDIGVIKESVRYTAEQYDDMRIVVIYPDLDNENAQELREFTPNVITRAITSDDFAYIIDNKLTEYDIDILNEKQIEKPAKKRFYGLRFNAKTIFVVAAVVLAVLLIFGIVYKSFSSVGSENDNEETLTELETITEFEIEIPTEPETGDEFINTFPAETVTQSPTIPTEKNTEATKATEKPTEKKKTPSSSSNSSVVYDPLASSQSPVSSQPPSSQPVYEPEPIPVETDPPYTSPVSSEIIDDGKIYLDPTSVTLKVGQTYEIYVTGLSAANGCNWDVQNAAIVDFVSGDTTKVVIKAKGIGTTIITATSKSSGKSAQCVINVTK